MIISGFPGIGKTNFANSHPNSIDLDSFFYKWIFNGKEKSINPNWPENYLKDIKKATKKYEYIFISQEATIRDLLKIERIEYFVVYPSKDCKEEYIQRYIKRGNEYDFINLINICFDFWIDGLEMTEKNKIILSKGEYLSDKIE